MYSDIEFKNKYIKYKKKYNELKNTVDQTGGFFFSKSNNKPSDVNKKINTKYEFVKVVDDDIIFEEYDDYNEYLKKFNEAKSLGQINKESEPLNKIDENEISKIPELV